MNDKMDSNSPADLADDLEETAEDVWNEITEKEDTSTSDQLDQNDDPADLADVDDDQKPASGDDDQPDAEINDPDEDASTTSSDGDTKTLDPAELQAQIERLENKFRSEQGRVKSERRRAQDLQKRIKELESKLSSSSETEDEKRAREERLEQVQSAYGDVTAPLVEELKLLSSRVETITADEAARLEELKSELGDHIEEQQQEFTRAHPDGLNVVAKNSDAFKQWIDDQPKEMRDIVDQNRETVTDGTAVALVISRFKQHLSQTALPPSEATTQNPKPKSGIEARRERQIAGAQTSRSSRQQATTNQPASDADPETHWNYWTRKLGG